MIRFLFKGILRDRGRSLFPFLVITTGVFLTVALYCYIRGAEVNVIRANANLRSGHLMVVTRAYARDAAQASNELALTGAEEMRRELVRAHPDIDWVSRIPFGGLIDIPDENGETRVQAPASGLAVDLLTPGSPEPGLLNLKKILIRGRLPRAPGEILIGDELATKLKLDVGGRATLMATTMSGGLAMSNFTVAGTIRFGMRAMDRTGMIADLADIRKALDMDDATAQILGLYRDGFFPIKDARATAAAFNAARKETPGDYVPLMQTLDEQPGMDLMFNSFGKVSGVILFIFMLAMALIMWNAGLVGTLRRYGEFGLRLAIGEDNGGLYRRMIAESLLIGFMGSVAGTILGLALSYYLQVHGIDFSALLKNMSFLMDSVLRCRITPASFIIGFVPGLLASLIGTAIAGRAVYKRQTARLFKEFES